MDYNQGEISDNNDNELDRQKELLMRYELFNQCNPDCFSLCYKHYNSTMFEFLSNIENPLLEISIVMFFLKIYQKMKMEFPDVCARNSTTFGIISQILKINYEHLPNRHGVEELSEDENNYIDNRDGVNFATNHKTGQKYNVRDFYNYFRNQFKDNSVALE